jgi:hypothetical protein
MSLRAVNTQCRDTIILADIKYRAPTTEGLVIDCSSISGWKTEKNITGLNIMVNLRFGRKIGQTLKMVILNGSSIEIYV